MNLYGATALVDGKPTGAFLIARDNDDAAAKAMSRMPEGGKLTHIVQFCEARIGTLQRNRLYEYCPQSDQIEFTCVTLLHLIGAMSQANNMLRAAISGIQEIVAKCGLRQYAFVVTESNGVIQHHNCYHTDLEKATEQAEQFAREQYGTGAKVTNIEEIKT